jgi:hypothetical protein
MPTKRKSKKKNQPMRPFSEISAPTRALIRQPLLDQSICVKLRGVVTPSHFSTPTFQMLTSIANTPFNWDPSLSEVANAFTAYSLQYQKFQVVRFTAKATFCNLEQALPAKACLLPSTDVASSYASLDDMAAQPLCKYVFLAPHPSSEATKTIVVSHTIGALAGYRDIDSASGAWGGLAGASPAVPTNLAYLHAAVELDHGQVEWFLAFEWDVIFSGRLNQV